MHEFSIAMNIVDLATEYALEDGAAVIREVELEVGELSGVVVEALEFALQSAVRDTMLGEAVISITLVPGRARCTNCHHEYPTNDLFSCCPECKSCAPDIIRGKELRVKSLVVDQ